MTSGSKRVGRRDDFLDPRHRHPRLASVKVGEGGNAEAALALGPLRRRDGVAGHHQPEARLDGKGVGAGGDRCHRPVGEGAEEGAARHHAKSDDG